MTPPGGRKYGLSILGIGCIVGLTVAGFVAAIIRADLATLAGAILPVSIGAIAGVVATFITGNSAVTYSEAGYGYALEKAGDTRGWTFTVFEEAFNQGYPQELQHFVQCVRDDRPPRMTGEDGRAVLEIIYAAYESAGTRRAVTPGHRRGVSKPIDLWLDAGAS